MLAAPAARDYWTPVSADEKLEVLRALEDILASPYFRNSKRYPALLRYLVEQTLSGRGDELKERTVGIEVFGRSPDYDTNLDTIVRYTAGEVRKRLALYYQNSPVVPIQITLTARSYHAEFVRTGNLTPVRAEDVEAHPSLVPASETPKNFSNSSKNHLRMWAFAGAILLGLLFIGIRSWITVRNDAIGHFWSPILEQKVPTVISLGGVVFSPRSDTGTEVASDSSSVNPYLSFENGLAMGRIAALVNARGGNYRVQPAAYTTLAEIRENPTVLVGAYNNDWTYRLVEPLRFHFTPHPDERIVDSKDSTHFWMRDRSRPFNNGEDYALVVRFRNPSTDSMVVVIAGLQRFGTDAASQFATSPDSLKELDHRLGSSWHDKNIEVVLQVDVVNGRAGAPIIQATEVW
jgi:hypothetical protein